MRRKYELQDLKIGETVFIPWIPTPTLHRSYKSQQAIFNAIYNERKKGKKFKRKPRGDGLLVTRVE